MNEGIIDNIKDRWNYASNMAEVSSKAIHENYIKKYELTHNKTSGPLHGDKISTKEYNEYLVEDWFILITGFKIENNHLEINIKPYYNSDYAFSTCPFFYKLYKKIQVIISIDSIRTSEALEERISKEFPKVYSMVEEAKQQFIEDFNDLISKAENTRGYSCIFDSKRKKDLLSPLLSNKMSTKIYELTGDESFLSQDVKDIFIF